jgi:signal transduction histidine kinase/ActR/RegA family two-component response regulator
MKTLKKEASSKAAVILRQKAEALLQNKSTNISFPPSQADALKTIHELEVHQIELEMQNEELVLAKEQAEIAAEKYAELYDFAPIGYFTLSQDGEIVALNLCGSNMLGKERSRLQNSRFGFFVSDDTKAVFNVFLENTFNGTAKESCEVTLAATSGIPLYVQLTGVASKNKDHCLMTVVDNSSRKRAQEEHLKYAQQLEQTQKLESLGVLAGGIAHNFNNILTVVFGYIELAIKKSKDDKVVSFLSQSLTAIGSVRELTGQLLTFAKGGAPVRKISNLITFIQETAYSARGNSDVTLRFNIADDLWSCNIDKNQIGQVIGSIVINAQEAMQPCGTISLAAHNISVGDKKHPTLSQGDYVKISITDFGIGIPKENMACIFDPFYSTKEMGHGLGLSTSYSIVNRHGGCIEVESQPGKGSTFSIYLPSCAQPADPKIAANPDVKYNGGGGRIIVMDDEELLRNILRNELEELGYTALCKNNGREAIDFFLEELKANRPVAGLIFDLTVLGGMGGKEAVAEIRKFNLDVPVFVASGYADDAVMKDPVAYGFTASICKPFGMADLGKMLAEHLKFQH